jgi:hypothetical protein
MIWEGAIFNLQQLSDAGATGEYIYLKLAPNENQSTKGEIKSTQLNLIMSSLLCMVELIVILVMISQKMESMSSCAGPFNRAYLMPLHLFFKQRKAQTHR